MGHVPESGFRSRSWWRHASLWHCSTLYPVPTHYTTSPLCLSYSRIRTSGLGCLVLPCPYSQFRAVVIYLCRTMSSPKPYWPTNLLGLSHSLSMQLTLVLLLNYLILPGWRINYMSLSLSLLDLCKDLNMSLFSHCYVLKTTKGLRRVLPFISDLFLTLELSLFCLSV